MRLSRRDLDKLCLVRWKDAKGCIGTTVDEFVANGWMMNESVGWLKYYDKEKIILASERSSEGARPTSEYDLAWIPRGWVEKVYFLSNPSQ